jgi:hypothetical protein
LHWITLALVMTAACGPSRTPHQAMADLNSPKGDVRLDAARDLESNARKHGGLPPDIVDGLLARAPTEPDPPTKGALMLALGYTGDPRAKPHLDAYLQTTDPDQQRWAARAYKKYVVKTGQVPPGHEFPDHWPYGSPGYPPPVEKN